MKVILSGIRDKKVWAYRVTQAEWSYESWVVNVTSLRRWAGQRPGKQEYDDIPDGVKVT